MRLKKTVLIGLAGVALAGLLVYDGVALFGIIYTDFAYGKIREDMPEAEVDAICRVFKKEVVSLNETAWLKGSPVMPKVYEKIVVYRYCGDFDHQNTIEVVYSADRKAVLCLPGYE